MAKTPLQQVKEEFGDKAKLVEALKQLTGEDLWLGQTSEKGLERVSNAKLLRLHRVFSAVKKYSPCQIKKPIMSASAAIRPATVPMALVSAARVVRGLDEVMRVVLAEPVSRRRCRR